MSVYNADAGYSIYDKALLLSTRRYASAFSTVLPEGHHKKSVILYQISVSIIFNTDLKDIHVLNI